MQGAQVVMNLVVVLAFWEHVSAEGKAKYQSLETFGKHIMFGKKYAELK
jgi:hypothetical protein